ncbi:MAG: YlxR family protein [Lachnospiraceae bacterium]|nr:YlxR family protein [Lachnospiraceae bacterium]
MSATKKIPMRQCVGCGEMKPKKELIRVLKTEENNFIIDKTGRKNGRGAYICLARECLEKAIKSRGLERSFKMKISEEVYESLKEEFE